MPLRLGRNLARLRRTVAYTTKVTESVTLYSIENYELDILGNKNDAYCNIDSETLVLELPAHFLDRCTVVFAAAAGMLRG